MSGQGPGQVPVTVHTPAVPLAPTTPPAIRVTPLGIELAVAPPAPTAATVAEQAWKSAGADLAAVKTLSDAWSWFVAPPVTPGPQLTAPVGPYIPVEAPPLPSTAAYQVTDPPNLSNTALRSRYGSIFESMQSFQNTPLPSPIAPPPTSTPTQGAPKLSPPVQEPESKKTEEKPKGLKKITEGAKKLLGLKKKDKEKKEDPKVSTVVIGTDPLTGKTQTAKVVVAKDAKSANEAAKALSQGATAESAAKVAQGGSTKDLPKNEAPKADAPKPEGAAEAPTQTVVVVASAESAPRAKGEKAPTAAEVQQQAVQKATETVTQMQSSANLDKVTEALLGIPAKPTQPDAAPTVVVVQDSGDKKTPPASDPKLPSALVADPKKAEAPKTAAEVKSPPTAQEAVGQAQQAVANATAVAAQGGSLEQIAAELAKPEAGQGLDAKVAQALTTEPKKGEAPIVVVQATKPPTEAKAEVKPNPTAKEAITQAQQSVTNATAVAAQGGSVEQIAAELAKPEATQALDAKVVQALTTEPKKGEAPVKVTPQPAADKPAAPDKPPTAKEAITQAQQSVTNATAVATQGGSVEQIAAELAKPEATQALDAKVVQALTTEPKKGEAPVKVAPQPAPADPNKTASPPKAEEKPAEKGSFKEAANKVNQSVQEATDKVNTGSSLEDVTRSLTSPQANEALDAKAAEALTKSDKKSKNDPVVEAPRPAPKAPEPKVAEPKANEPKANEPKANEPKANEPKANEPKANEPKANEPKAAEPKANEPKAGDPKANEPKANEPKANEPKAAEPRANEPKATEPRAAEPKPGEPRGDQPKSEPGADRVGEPKAEPRNEARLVGDRPAEPKGEPKADLKAEPRNEQRPEPRSENRPAEPKPEPRSESKPETRNDRSPDHRPDNRLVGEPPEVRSQTVAPQEEARGVNRPDAPPAPRGTAPSQPPAVGLRAPEGPQPPSENRRSAPAVEGGAPQPGPAPADTRGPQYRVSNPMPQGVRTGGPVSASQTVEESPSSPGQRETRSQAGLSAAQSSGVAPAARSTTPNQRSQDGPSARTEVAGGGAARAIESGSSSSGQQQGSGDQQSPPAPPTAAPARLKASTEVAADKGSEPAPAPTPAPAAPAPVKPQVPTPPQVTYQAPKETAPNEPIWEDRFREANREERDREVQEERRSVNLPPTPGKPGVTAGPVAVSSGPAPEASTKATTKTATAATGAVTAQEVQEVVAAAEAATGSSVATGQVPGQAVGLSTPGQGGLAGTPGASAAVSPEGQVKEISDRVAHGEAPAMVNGNVETMVKQAGQQSNQSSGAQQPGQGSGSEGGEMGGGGAGADSSGGHSSGGHQQGSSSGSERDNTISKLNALSVGELQQLLLQTLFAMDGTTARVKGVEEDGPVLLNLNDVVEIRGANGELVSTRVLTKREVFETNFRTNLIRAAELADPTWPSTDRGVDLPSGQLEQPETRGENLSVVARNGFWEVLEQGSGQRSLQLRSQDDQGQPVTASAALNDLFENKDSYALDGSISLRLLNLKAQLETVGAEDFDRNHGSLSLGVQGEQKTNPVYLGFQASSGGNRPFEVGQDRLIPGELRYFESAPNQGTSRLYLGRGKDGLERFWALDEGISQFDFRESAPVIVSGESREYLTSWSGAPPVSQLLALSADTDFLV